MKNNKKILLWFLVLLVCTILAFLVAFKSASRITGTSTNDYSVLATTDVQPSVVSNKVMLITNPEESIEKVVNLTEVRLPDWWDPAHTNSQLAYEMGRSGPILKLPRFLPMITSSNALMSYALGLARAVRVVGSNGSVDDFPFDTEGGMPALVDAVKTASKLNGVISVVDDGGNVVMVTNPNAGGLDLVLPEIVNLRVDGARMVEIIPPIVFGNKVDDHVLSKRDWIMAEPNSDKLAFRSFWAGKEGMFIPRANNYELYMIRSGHARENQIVKDVPPPFLKRR